MKKSNKKKKVFWVVFFFLAGAVFLFYDFKSQGAAFSATFADNILRPLIGDNLTIKLETIFFNTQDKITRVSYHSPLSKDSAFKKLIPQLDSIVWKPMITIRKGTTLVPILESAVYAPDPERPYALVHLVRFNLDETLVGAVAGKKEPAAQIGKPGPGVIPIEVKESNSLLAAFNGGFQYRDGQYGMVVDNITYLPLKSGLATLMVGKDGQVDIEEYQGNIDPQNYRVLRQNGIMLIKNSVVIPSSNDKLAKIWGRSITSNMYTWRSGIGLTTDNKLVYAAGGSLIPRTLGEALLAAGATKAMQLDINPFWVRFSLFKPLGSGKYKHQPLFSKMYDGGKEFLSGYIKDFFYIYLRNPVKENNLVYFNTQDNWNL